MFGILLFYYLGKYGYLVCCGFSIFDLGVVSLISLYVFYFLVFWFCFWVGLSVYCSDLI